MFLAEVEGGLTNDHQAQGWNVGVVKMMVIQSLEDYRNLDKSKIVVFVKLDTIILTSTPASVSLIFH